MTARDTPDAAQSKSASEADKDALPKRLREAWHKTVGAFATDDRGTTSLLDRLVGFGHLSAEEAKRVLVEARDKIEENKKELDARVDDSVKAITQRFTDTEVKRLEERIAQLEKQIAALEP